MKLYLVKELENKEQGATCLNINDTHYAIIGSIVDADLSHVDDQAAGSKLIYTLSRYNTLSKMEAVWRDGSEGFYLIYQNGFPGCPLDDCYLFTSHRSICAPAKIESDPTVFLDITFAHAKARHIDDKSNLEPPEETPIKGHYEELLKLSQAYDEPTLSKLNVVALVAQGLSAVSIDQSPASPEEALHASGITV